MIFTSTKIRELIAMQCPNVVFPWLTDEDFAVFNNENELKNVLHGFFQDGRPVSVSNRTFQETYECDDFALSLHANVKEFAVDNLDLKSNIAFGECYAKKVKGLFYKHNLNITFVGEIIYMVEPQTDEYWRKTLEDNVVFLKI